MCCKFLVVLICMYNNYGLFVTEVVSGDFVECKVGL